MEIISENKSLFNELICKFTAPAKYKIKFYQITVLMYIDHILTTVINKYMFFRVKIEEKKTNLKIIKFHEEYKLKLKHSLSNENLRKTSLVIVKTLNHKAKDSFDKLQSMHEHCVSHDQTPELFCEPYIHNGFRPINQPYSYYVKSLFKKHNETVNAWSHYIGSFYTLYLAFTLDFSDPYSWPILTCLITATIMFFSSATAHLMHQKSHYCHMTCFLCDFGGISFNGFGAAFMQTYLCSPLWYYKSLEPYLLPLIGFQSALCCLLNSIAQTKYKRPYPPIKRFLQFAPCGILWTFALVPVILTYVLDDSSNNLSINYRYHIAHVVIFLIGAAFFALDFPQRYFPGRLDFFGQGHNLFHLCIFFVAYFQFNGCYLDYKTNRDLIASSRQPPTFSFCFMSLFVLIAYYIYLIKNFYKMIGHNFDSEGNLIKVKKVK